MARQIKLKLWWICLIISLGIGACRSAAPPQPLVVAGTEAPTPAPTVLLPTARPPATKGPPTPTSTLVVRPSATPTFVTSPATHVYVVQEADTLFGIAVQFNLTTEALATANGLNEADALQVGQRLIIPVVGDAPPLVATPPGQVEEIAQPSATPEAASPPIVQAQPAETNTSTIDRTAPLFPLAQPPVSSGPSLPPPPPPSSPLPPAVPNSPPPPPPPSLPSGPLPPPIIYGGNINPLTGLPVDNPAKLQRRPLLVRVGNDVGARQSQAGLNSADIVYEEIAEGWVTRFTAIFLAETPRLVAPVRSARLINVQLAPQYRGALAHSGGSDPVRWEISQAPIVNLDEFYHPVPYFYRPNAGWQTRLGIDTQAARSYMVSQGLEAAVNLEGFLFRETIEQGTPAPNIYIPYPGSTSFSRWGYDPARGTYLRWIIGAPLYDVNGGQVAADNVIIYFAEHQATNIVEDSNGATSLRILVNGRGPAWFFRDGKLNKGFWQTNGSRPPYFSDEAGSPYPLKPGNSWVEVVPTYFTIGINSPDEASSRP